MEDWTSGYQADVEYTAGYYRELNPLCVKLSFLNQGVAYPEFQTACELGFGQGLSINIHAASSSIQWWGNDFNPTQTSLAIELASSADSKAMLCDDSFEEFLARDDIPDFDYIGLHGIWSWVSGQNRDFITKFIKKKLKVGGVVYVSYNTQPGWSNFAPIRDLMAEHTASLGSNSTPVESRVDAALDFVENLLATNTKYALANPHLSKRVKDVKSQDRQYLAHEYFNLDWYPTRFSTLSKDLEPAKVQYACSANFLEQIDEINLTEDQQRFLKTINDPKLRESTRDIILNTQFRKDFWVKGLRKLTRVEQSEKLRNTSIILTTHRPSISLTVNCGIGEANLSEQIYNPILDLLSDHKPRTIAEIEVAVKDKGIVLAQIMQAILILAGIGHLAEIQEQSLINKAKKQTEKLNSALIKKAYSRDDMTFLASPVTGGGHGVRRFQQLFIGAIKKGLKQPSDWVEFVWEIMAAQDQKISKEGRLLNGHDEVVEELLVIAHSFAEKEVPVLKALQIL